MHCQHWLLPLLALEIFHIHIPMYKVLAETCQKRDNEKSGHSNMMGKRSNGSNSNRTFDQRLTSARLKKSCGNSQYVINVGGLLQHDTHFEQRNDAASPNHTRVKVSQEAFEDAKKQKAATQVAQSGTKEDSSVQGVEDEVQHKTGALVPQLDLSNTATNPNQAHSDNGKLASDAEADFFIHSPQTDDDKLASDADYYSDGVEELSDEEKNAINVQPSKIVKAEVLGLENSEECQACWFYTRCVALDHPRVVFCRKSFIFITFMCCILAILCVALTITAWGGSLSGWVSFIDDALDAMDEWSETEKELLEEKEGLRQQQQDVRYELAAIAMRLEQNQDAMRKDDEKKKTAQLRQEIDSGVASESVGASSLRFRRPPVSSQLGATSTEHESDREGDEVGDKIFEYHEEKLDEKINAASGAAFQAALPYFLLAKQVNKIQADTTSRIYDRSKKLVEEEVNTALQNSVGIPKVVNFEFWEDCDWFPVVMLVAGLFAPLQLSSMYFGALIGVVSRILYLTTFVVVMYLQWDLTCVHRIDIGSQPNPVKDWLIIDAALQVLMTICKLPVCQLCRRALGETSRYYRMNENSMEQDPYEGFKGAVLYDAKYGGIAMFRADQISDGPAMHHGRYILYVQFVWLLFGCFRLFEHPFQCCAAWGMLLLARTRVCLFIVFAGWELLDVVASILQTLMKSDKVFHEVLTATAKFDKELVPLGLPVTTMMARVFVARDSSNFAETELKLSRREVGLVQTDILEREAECKKIQKEINSVQSRLKELEADLEPSLAREKMMQDIMLQQIKEESALIGQEAERFAEEAAARIEQSEEGKKLVGDVRGVYRQGHQAYEAGGVEEVFRQADIELQEKLHLTEVGDAAKAASEVAVTQLGDAAVAAGEASQAVAALAGSSDLAARFRHAAEQAEGLTAFTRRITRSGRGEESKDEADQSKPEESQDKQGE
eukprot:gnl/MRDRNA2_/MRDRNA2_91256_c0_seq1.p1 gnl/MRDRNA2_/MRDRNA2_91256_c0~~gnl/MRDRNA2_/MRDRNA2_91256_c0_seq1.p1  ORF type:complete len:951 (+),score=200.30 gnl/MRDRNA2_/MRDRNA2_91256_c0_seq1:134-2986(+)